MVRAVMATVMATLMGEVRGVRMLIRRPTVTA